MAMRPPNQRVTFGLRPAAHRLVDGIVQLDVGATSHLRMFHTFLLARNTTPVQMWERPERDAFGAALRPNETGREPFVSGFPDGVACRTFLAIEQTYLKCALLSRRTFQIAAVSTRRALRSCEMHGT